MKGGYQILDLTGATAGSPVEVKGIYKAAAGNNGKPVLILTNDGQRVYSEIAEDDGDYITCYISAEGKTVNITIKSDDSVTTVISDPGASITGLEQAVNELNDNKAAKSDITDLECTGTKNTTGNTIAAGRYFYLNGDLCQATADIANNATFTLNTNFTVVTIDEELSALNSNIDNFGSYTLLATFTNTSYENITIDNINNYRYILLIQSNTHDHVNATSIIPIGIFKNNRVLSASSSSIAANAQRNYSATVKYIDDYTIDAAAHSDYSSLPTVGLLYGIK